jgi:(E)-4-hydroxy-3-methylbut-2-enyl-diphosphate synthase
MQYYSESLTSYKRIQTRPVKVGNLVIGGGHPIRVQTMTTTDTMDTDATVAQVIRCIEAGAELVRVTAPSKKEAENLANIKAILHSKGYHTPLVADIHFTPNAAEIAARIVEKVRVNPGNYVDKKKFEQIDYTDAEYVEEIERIREKFSPLVLICKEHGTAMRIGTNHGSLSDRIMSRYGDTAIGMVESAMEFLRIARSLDYHQIILSMKSSNPQEFNELYPLHLGVTEAGDGEDGRIKSAIGIGTLLEDGIGDTIRVSLTEDPELEIPVCLDLVKRYDQLSEVNTAMVPELTQLPYSPFEYTRRTTKAVRNIGGKQVPVVIADLSHLSTIKTTDLVAIGYTYDVATDKWTISDAAADYVFIGNTPLDFNLPGTLNIIATPAVCAIANNTEKYHPISDAVSFIALDAKHPQLNFVQIECYSDLSPIADELLIQIAKDPSVVFCLSSQCNNAMQAVRRMAIKLMQMEIQQPIILVTDSQWKTTDEHLIHFNNSSIEQFLNTTAFGILQATRTRISKTEYISCPSCGRTLFELQETTAKIRAVTNHLKGLKIAIMGCIVNGPGEMADADFGYVGSGVGKITLYKGKEVMKRNIDSNVAVDELILLLKEHNAWIEPSK